MVLFFPAAFDSYIAWSARLKHVIEVIMITDKKRCTARTYRNRDRHGV